jgi:hypothetical protein
MYYVYLCDNRKARRHVYSANTADAAIGWAKKQIDAWRQAGAKIPPSYKVAYNGDGSKVWASWDNAGPVPA